MFQYHANHSFEPKGLSAKVEKTPLMSLDLSRFPSDGNLDVYEAEHTRTPHQSTNVPIYSIYLQYRTGLII